MTNPMELLIKGAAILETPLAPETLAQVQVYLQELKTWNARVNLTGLKTDREIVIKHFLDSLAVLPYLAGATSLVDLGSGAGFPGLVLKLARPDLALTLVESRGKKAAFLQYLVALLKLPGVEVKEMRLTPKLARKWGPSFTAVISRATFKLPELLALAAPLLFPGGRVLALKGPRLAAEELEAGRQILSGLEFGTLELKEYQLPLTSEKRLLVMAQKAPG
jgi:16S rRNA (guanine527-N7)-methyltransferase|uniref:Ribosomal RNA small subunit methyltransferase G n=1 Tax=Desulfobacca acetoxidans TaxID=60893 RepID=A0A7C5ELI8_9BACT